MTDAVLVRLGAELRRFREDAGLSGSEVARALGWSQPKISRVETGRFAASLEEIATLLDYYGSPEEVRAELLATVARREGMAGAWVVRAGGTRRRQGEIQAVEQRVERLRQYQAVIVPGLLQTRAYARSVAEAMGFAESAAIAERRMARQEAFKASTPGRYEVVLDARALLRWAGGRSVMIEQLQSLIDTDVNLVDLRILPLGSDAAAMTVGGFLVYEFSSDKPAVIMLESQTADTYLSDEVDVSAYGSVFDRLQKDALSVEASRQYLERSLRELRSGREIGAHDG
ncbi:helix-turn-helix transcriptional regulator [Nocardioides sp. NPDC006303]|uniref:helix-turn-helix domain-containing protein n=1 Tax=Nocardioides sp. NPDC006303 TaxID=3156747 RepID=UPI0033A498A2